MLSLMKIRIRIFFNIKYTYIVVRKEGIVGNLSKNSCKYVTRQDYFSSFVDQLFRLLPFLVKF